MPKCQNDLAWRSLEVKKKKKKTVLRAVFETHKGNIKSVRHPVFPCGHPSKYLPGPTLLNSGDQTRTCVFNVVWL